MSGTPVFNPDECGDTPELYGHLYRCIEVSGHRLTDHGDGEGSSWSYRIGEPHLSDRISGTFVIHPYLLGRTPPVLVGSAEEETP